MVKKTTTTDLSKVDNVDNFALTDAAIALAARFGLNLADTKETRVDRAALNMNRSMHAMIAAGLDLASLKADCEHGEFLTLIEERGFEQRSAYRAISYTRFLLSRSDEERERLLDMPKSKVLALASADEAVIDDLLSEDERTEFEALSVRELRNRISELQAKNTDLSVEKETAEAERDGAIKKLNKRNRDADEQHVPVVVADIRLEMAAQIKKAELAIGSLYPIGVEAYNLTGNTEAHEWVNPTLRLGVSGLLALRELVDGSIKSYAEAMGEDAKRLASQPHALSFLDETEVKSVAEDWARLTAMHTFEAELRKYERDKAKPQGKGRPAKAPEAPVLKGGK